MTRSALLALLLIASGCDDASSDASASDARPDSVAADTSAQTASSSVPEGAASDTSEAGFFQSILDVVMANPRRDREARQTSDCTTEKDYSGRSLPYHSIVIDNGNGFNTTHESFPTSSPDAQTPYVAYASWDPCALALGLTGSAVGAGDCSGPDCRVIDQPESAYRYWVVYFDTDPQGSAGTQWPRRLGPVPERLPFRADYLLEVRLDGVTQQIGDGMSYQGNAQLYTRTSDWRVGLEESWQSAGREGLSIGDNSSSNFIELTVDRAALGDPCAVQAVGWVVDTRADTLFAHWPPPRGMRFDGEASDGRPDSTAAPAERNRPVAADSLVLDVYGFMLTDGQAPNAKGNLNRTDFSLVGPDCTQPRRPAE